MPRNLLFGECTSRLYRLLVWAPGWLASLLLGTFPGGGAALRAAFNQASQWHGSGSGALLSAMAGGLGVTLGGPRYYLEQKVRYARVGGTTEPSLETPMRVWSRLNTLMAVVLLLLVGFAGLAVYAHHVS